MSLPEEVHRWELGKEYEVGQGTWAGLAMFWALTLIWCAVSFGFTGSIPQVCGILLQVCSILVLIVCCKATYSSILNPQKYIVGNFVPGDTSDSDSNSVEDYDSDDDPID
jgi:hypothetical protein